MAKMALLIGVSDYEPGLIPLPGTAKDVEAMRRVLQNPDIGGFDDVKTSSNPEPLEMQEAIETLFSGCTKDDLVLLFFSGHGIKDDRGKLYLASRITRKNPQGELIKATAVPAGFVQDIMSNSRSKRQVVILDCCFSGAFAEGWSAKDDGSVDVKDQLGGEGRAVLTSSTSTQYSFEQEGAGLSTYTRYLVEGIETGAADLDSDGVVSVDELHEYAKGKVQAAAPAMKPEIYAVKEGYKIHLSQAPTGDPKLRYRKEVEHCVSRGKISVVSRYTLDALRDSLGLVPGDAAAIEDEVLQPYREYQKKLQRYEQVLVEATQGEHSLSNDTRNELKRLQQVLKLRDEDIAQIEARNTPPPIIQPSIGLWIGGAFVVLAMATAVFVLPQLSAPTTVVPKGGSDPLARRLLEDTQQAAKEKRWGDCLQQINQLQGLTVPKNIMAPLEALENQCSTGQFVLAQEHAQQQQWKESYEDIKRLLSLAPKSSETIQAKQLLQKVSDTWADELLQGATSNGNLGMLNNDATLLHQAVATAKQVPPEAKRHLEAERLIREWNNALK